MMMKPNQKLIDMWTRAAGQYHAELAGSPAEKYLEERGLLDGAERFMLGYVADPAPGHEDRFIGSLSIPYLTPSGCVAFKFRSLEANAERKYDSPSGQRHHLFNVQALLDAIETVCVVEGELDAIASTLAGYPAVALPGVNGWKRHFARCFDGVGRVLVITDNDDKPDGTNPGQELAKKLLEVLPMAVRVSLPLGEDINSTILSHGAQHYAELIGAVE